MNIVDTEVRVPHPTAVRRPRFGLWLAIFWVLLCVLLQVSVPWLGERFPSFDQQIANMLTGVLLILGALAFVTHGLFGKRYRGWQRLIPLLWLTAVVTLFGMLFRFERFTGDLRPEFSWRFSRPKVLPRPVRPVAAATRATDQVAIDPTNSESDRADSGADPSASSTKIAESTPSGSSDFPQFLGPNRDGVIQNRLFDGDWVTNPPHVIWKQPIGSGWSGFAIVGDRAVTLEQRDDEQWISCYLCETGELIWKEALAGYHFHPLGGAGPRSTPTIAGDRVFAQTATGQVVCLSLADGERIWLADLLEIAGIDQLTSEQAIAWGRAGSPLIVDNRVVVPFYRPAESPENVSCLIALDIATGAPLWEGVGDSMSYASPALLTLAGVRQVVSVNEQSVAGFDPAEGKRLWQFEWPGSSAGPANCSSPLAVGNNQLLVSKGYGGGGAVWEIGLTDGTLKPTELWHRPQVLRTKFSNAVLSQDQEYAFALSDGVLECIQLSNGQRMWRQPRTYRYGQGQMLRVEDLLLVQCEEGDVALVVADSTRFEEVARLPVLRGTTWNFPAISGDLLMVRNADEAAAIRLPTRREQATSSERQAVE
jgi:outer membrane protein assembly factor BamB